MYFWRAPEVHTTSFDPLLLETQGEADPNKIHLLCENIVLFLAKPGNEKKKKNCDKFQLLCNE